jgi:hypothetical protein
MNYTLKIPTATPLTLRELKLVKAGTFLGATFALTKGTASPSDWATLLDTSGNTQNVTLTPDTGEIILTMTALSPAQTVAVVSPNLLPTSVYQIDGGRWGMFEFSGIYDFYEGIQYASYRVSREAIRYYDAVSNSQSPEVINYYTTELFTSGGVNIGNSIRFRYVDPEGNYWSSFRNVLNSNNTYTRLEFTYRGHQITNAHTKLRERSNLANLYASQAPVITGIEVFSHNDTQDRVVVKADKVAQVSMYVMATDFGLNDTNIVLFSRDSQAYSKEHTYYIPKLAGTNKIVAIPSGDSFYRDFNNRNAVNALNTYSYSTPQLVVSRYNEGYEDGKKAAYQDMYALGSSYGWNYDFGTRTDYGTPAVNNAFLNTIADGQYIKASKEIFNRGGSYGFTYNTNSTDKNYYLAQQESFINTLTGAGAIEAYKAVYDRGAAYGYTYDSSHTSKAYYQTQEPTFVSKIDSTSRLAGYKLAYSELFTAGRVYQGSAGLPLGGSLWVDDTASNINFALRKDEFVRHMYNSGYIRAKQETFDRGNTYGYDFRNFINVNAKVLSDASLPGDYYNQGQNFIDTVTADARSDGYKDVYNYVNTQYGFIYDSTNATGMSITDYVKYLSSLKPNAVTRVNVASRIGAYNDVFGHIANEYKFVYNNLSSDITYYTGLVDAATKQAYNYGARAAFQSMFDQGGPYHFNTLTSYQTYRDTLYTLKANKDDATTTYYRSVSQVYTDAVRDFGSVFTFKRFFTLGTQYGFSYDPTQTSINYYDGKREEFLEIFSEGNYSEGMRTIFESARIKYGFQYTFTPNKEAMNAQLIPMETWVENSNKAAAYKYTLTSLNTSGLYNIPFTESTGAEILKNQILPNLNTLKNASAVEAYNYVMVTANSRTGYTVPVSSNAGILKSQVIPMFKYVEDYKEADAYRRVHNYAKNFLDNGYTFQDSTDPRVLENQVPGLFEYLERNGGYLAYKHVHDTAQVMFKWNYYDDKSVGTLKTQIVPMFEFINSTYVDIKSISEPYIEWPGKIVFDVELNREAGVYAILVDKTTNEHLAGCSSMVPSLNHTIKFNLSKEALKKPVGLVVIPTPRNMIA